MKATDVMTPNGLLAVQAELLRKLQSGTYDLDQAKVQQSSHKHMIRTFDVMLQAVRVYKGATVPGGWSPAGDTA